MTKPMHRSHSLRRVKVKTPSGKVVVHYKKKKPSKARCAICKKPLQGVPRLEPIRMRKLAKTQRRPERPYGGNLCASCMRKLMREKARSLNQKLAKS